MMLEIGPADGLEAMIGVQLVITHAMAVKHWRRAATATHPERENHYQRLAEKAMDAFRKQMEALTRTRTRARPQRIIVERVNVSEGGQAVIAGNVKSTRRGGSK
jgi:hypothetical protein